MNPTNFSAPSDIARFVMTDYRPSKLLYGSITNNNSYRTYMQKNAHLVRNIYVDKFEKDMWVKCDTPCCIDFIPEFIFKDGYTCWNERIKRMDNPLIHYSAMIPETFTQTNNKDFGRQQ